MHKYSVVTQSIHKITRNSQLSIRIYDLPLPIFTLNFDIHECAIVVILYVTDLFSAGFSYTSTVMHSHTSLNRAVC